MVNNTMLSQACTSFLVVDLSKIPPAEMQNWTQKNSMYFAPGGTSTMQNIDASKIPENDFALWLYDNQYFLSYNDSYTYIECAHLITDPKSIKIVDEAPAVCQMSFTTVITEIEAAGGNFNNPSYQEYAKMVCSGNKLTVTMITLFDSMANCYSIPFLNSVLKVNLSLSLNSIITFKSCLFPSENYEKVTLSVDLGNNVIKSYDFSQTPP